MPRLSIGLPVYNGERFLAECLDTLLAQTFTDFELIVSDNASTDRTPEILATYAARDPRIQIHRLETNVGAAPNFNRTVDLASGEYFKWAAHDDRHEPTFLERCVEVLDQDPAVVLCYTGVRVIDGDGGSVENYENPLRYADAEDSCARFADLLRGVHACFEVFGVMRLNALQRTPRIGAYTSSDRTLLAELGLVGKLHEVPEPLFLSREHERRSIKLAVHDRTSWFDSTQRKRRFHMPYWRSMVLEPWRSVRRVGLPRRQRWRCYGALSKAALGRWRLLRGDLKRVLLGG